MPVFQGFHAGQEDFTPLPEQFFSELLAEIDHLGELKLMLYAFWQVEHQEGQFRWLERADFSADSLWMSGLGRTPAQAQIALDEALERAVQRGGLLRAELAGGRSYYFLNTPRGRAALEALQNGRWQPEPGRRAPLLQIERPNIYTLYEQNIGPLTPMIAETLRDAEAAYPAEWLGEALRIAVEKNARSWRYVEAILRSWKEKGRHEQNRRDAKEAGKQYRSDEFADFIDN